MKRFALVVMLLVALLAVAMPVVAQNCQELPGAIGHSTTFGSGWLDLLPPINFKKGEKLRLWIDGDAQKVLVRLLPSRSGPDDEVGLLPGIHNVESNKPVEITLSADYNDIKQISVHGGGNPWGHHSLGGDNGAATLESVERCSSP